MGLRPRHPAFRRRIDAHRHRCPPIPPPVRDGGAPRRGRSRSTPYRAGGETPMDPGAGATRMGGRAVTKKVESRPPDHLSGKRRWLRQPRVIPAVCVGAGATVHGKTVDVSRGGMLFEAHDGDIPPVGGRRPRAAGVPRGRRVRAGDDGEARQEGHRRRRRRPRDHQPLDRNFLRLGCKFRTPLTPRQCAKLGIDQTDAPDPSLDLDPEGLDGMQDCVDAGELLEVTAKPDRRKTGPERRSGPGAPRTDRVARPAREERGRVAGGESASTREGARGREHGRRGKSPVESARRAS